MGVTLMAAKTVIVHGLIAALACILAALTFVGMARADWRDEWLKGNIDTSQFGEFYSRKQYLAPVLMRPKVEPVDETLEWKNPDESGDDDEVPPVRLRSRD